MTGQDRGSAALRGWGARLAEEQPRPEVSTRDSSRCLVPWTPPAPPPRTQEFREGRPFLGLPGGVRGWHPFPQRMWIQAQVPLLGLGRWVRKWNGRRCREGMPRVLNLHGDG